MAVTLCLPSAPVTEDQFKVCIDGAQYGITSPQGNEWVLYGIPVREEGRFGTLFDLVRYVEALSQAHNEGLRYGEAARRAQEIISKGSTPPSGA